LLVGADLQSLIRFTDISIIFSDINRSHTGFFS
jgi:hypothetical protein